MSDLIYELVVSSIKLPHSNGFEPARADFLVAAQKCCEVVDRKLIGVGGVYG